MKNKELVEKLQEHDPELEVILGWEKNVGWHPTDNVELISDDNADEQCINIPIDHWFSKLTTNTF